MIVLLDKLMLALKAVQELFNIELKKISVQTDEVQDDLKLTKKELSESQEALDSVKSNLDELDIKAVQTTEQYLTEDQKMQARKNLGLYGFGREYPLLAEVGPDSNGYIFDVLDYFHNNNVNITNHDSINIEIIDAGTHDMCHIGKYQKIGEEGTDYNTKAGYRFWYWGNPSLIQNDSEVWQHLDYYIDTTEPSDAPFVLYYAYHEDEIKSPVCRMYISTDLVPTVSAVGFWINIRSGSTQVIYTKVPSEYIPIANGDLIGGIAADSVTEVDIQPVRIDQSGRLFTAPSVSNAVQYTEQTLTDEQKLQARTNIDAAGAAMIVARDYSTLTTVDGVTKVKADHTFEEIKAWHDAGGIVLFKSTTLMPVHSISSSNIIFIGVHWLGKEPAVSKVTIDTDGYVTTDNASQVPVPEVASVGQVLAVKTTNSQNYPQEWEPIDLPTKVSDLTNDSGFATEEYVDNSISAIPPSGIIDVVELPTEDIKEDAFYRVPTGKVVYNKYVATNIIIHCVDALPEIGEPAVSGDLSDLNNAIITGYYNITDNTCMAYVSDELSGSFNVPAGWYPTEVLMSSMGKTWSGVITNIDDDPCDSTYRLLLEYVVYSYKNTWISYKRIGKEGVAACAETFNSFTNIASGVYSHAEGDKTTASGDYSHAEGYDTTASGEHSHAEGYDTTASGNSSHAEGWKTVASGSSSHAEGYDTTAFGYYSHAEGYDTTASSEYSHAEGISTTASGYASHAEGNDTIASGHYSHAEGRETMAFGSRSHAEGTGSTQGITISGDANTLKYNLSQADSLIKTGLIVRYNNIYAKITAYDSTALTITVNKTLSTTALENAPAHLFTGGIAFGDNSHAEGARTTASGDSSHAEGSDTIASSNYSHAEGSGTIAFNIASHAEGANTIASGFASHAEGGDTIASSNYQHAQGKYNIEDTNNKYAHIVGNGTFEERSNAHTLDWDGNAWYQGDVYVGSTSGTNQDEGSKKLATEEYVDNKYSVETWTFTLDDGSTVTKKMVVSS